VDDAHRYRLLGRYQTPRFRYRKRGCGPWAKAPPGLFFALPAGPVISTILAMFAHWPIAS
jgi:hypothetical protein